MKLLYASDYDSQKDIPLSFYDMQRYNFHSGKKDGIYIKELRIFNTNGIYRICIKQLYFKKDKCKVIE